MPSCSSHLRMPLICLAALFVSCLQWSCGDKDGVETKASASGAAANTSSLTLVATTGMVADVVEQVVGNHARVITLIPAGADPHLWTPTRTDIMQLLEADALFMNGLGLEGRAGEAFSRVSNAGRPVCAVTAHLPDGDLLRDPSNPNHPNPHVWMDPGLWGATALAVAEIASQLDPAHAEEFQKNAVQYATEAKKVRDDAAAMLESVPSANRVLISSHDAFGYFGKRFGFEVRGIQGISTESEASVSDIERLVAEICERSIPTVFIETTVSDRTIRALVDGCAARGHSLKIGDALFSDSMGARGTPAGTWPGMIRHNASSVANGLRGGA
ncbi:MAG: manganese transporter [Phycisphaerales bacterium]|nr:manganese transporter [Phycisphaerales bacterium]